VVTTAGDETQTAVPCRFGQQQGITVDLVNDSDWTQQIVGVGPDWGFGTLPEEAHECIGANGGVGVPGITRCWSASARSPGPRTSCGRTRSC
jgi:hypothetical protein